MGTRRVLAKAGSPGAFYHCVTRVVDRRFALGDPEKEKFVKILQGTVRDRQSIKEQADPLLDVGMW
jgi:hypothetical protein